MSKKYPRWVEEDRGYATPCWIWQLYTQKSGYGIERIGGRKGTLYLAHRIAYEREYGAIPSGLHLDHLCRVRACVRPDHLEPVTQAENNIRSRRITPDIARKIIEAEGRQADIAAEFGVGQSHVSRLKRGALLWQQESQLPASPS